MANNNGSYKIAAFSVLFLALMAQKAEASVLVSWKSQTLAPQSYTGKHLPTMNSQIKAYLDVIEGGKNIDISKEEIQWFINDNFLAGGKGMKSISFNAPSIPGGNLELRAELPNKNILKTIEIPVVKPLVIIESAYKEGFFSTPSITLKGVPYFFNTKDGINLEYNWRVNGTSPENGGDPEVLNISLNGSTPDSFEVNVSLSISNNLRKDEVGGANSTFIYKK